MDNAERCPVRFPGGPGNLHGPLGVHTAGSNPLGDAGGPPGDPPGIALDTSYLFDTVLSSRRNARFIVVPVLESTR